MNCVERVNLRLRLLLDSCGKLLLEMLQTLLDLALLVVLLLLVVDHRVQRRR